MGESGSLGSVIIRKGGVELTGRESRAAYYYYTMPCPRADSSHLCAFAVSAAHPSPFAVISAWRTAGDLART